MSRNYKFAFAFLVAAIVWPFLCAYCYDNTRGEGMRLALELMGFIMTAGFMIAAGVLALESPKEVHPQEVHPPRW